MENRRTEMHDGFCGSLLYTELFELGGWLESIFTDSAIFDMASQ